MLVAFDGPASSKRYFGVQFYLEDRLGCQVNFVTEKVFSASLTGPVSSEDEGGPATTASAALEAHHVLDFVSLET